VLESYLYVYGPSAQKLFDDGAREIVEVAACDAAMPTTVSIVLAIKAGVMEMCEVFSDQGKADLFYEQMMQEYDIDPLDPDSCADDVLHLREEVRTK